MKTTIGSLLVTVVAAAALSYACSSSTPAPVDAGAGDGRATDAAPEAAGPCTADTKRVAEDDAGVCCAGLFKACIGSGGGDLSPCVCSKIACGTAAVQPPPNVPCCPPPVSSHCETPLGDGTSNTPGDTQCTCK